MLDLPLELEDRLDSEKQVESFRRDEAGTVGARSGDLFTDSLRTCRITVLLSAGSGRKLKGCQATRYAIALSIARVSRVLASICCGSSCGLARNGNESGKSLESEGRS
jgi:hypothetical protein